jgi:hypothetical protein
VQKPRRRNPFALNDGKLFWLALLTRDTGIPASQRLGLKDEVVALDLDLAVSFRLFRLREEEEKRAARRTAYEVSKMLFGGPDDDDDDILDSDVIRRDPYADEKTQVW